MSQENVEIIRCSLDAWNRHDLEALLALAHPEFEYVNAPSAVEPGTRRGHEGLASVARTQWEYMPGTVIELDRVHDRGDEVNTEGHLSRLMPRNDSRVNTSVLSSWKFRDGMVVRLETLGAGPEFAEALEAAGLSEWAMSEENVEIVRRQIEGFQAGMERGDPGERIRICDPVPMLVPREVVETTRPWPDE